MLNGQSAVTVLGGSARRRVGRGSRSLCRVRESNSQGREASGLQPPVVTCPTRRKRSGGPYPKIVPPAGGRRILLPPSASRESESQSGALHYQPVGCLPYHRLRPHEGLRGPPTSSDSWWAYRCSVSAQASLWTVCALPPASRKRQLGHFGQSVPAINRDRKGTTRHSDSSSPVPEIQNGKKKDPRCSLTEAHPRVYLRLVRP